MTSVAVALTLAAPLDVALSLGKYSADTQLQTDPLSITISLATTGTITTAFVPTLGPIAYPGAAPIIAAISIVSERGAQGVPGPIGPHGLYGATFEYVQDSPSNVWIINHNLGFDPAVTVVDPNGTVEGEVLYLDVNNLSITFSIPITGTAYLV